MNSEEKESALQAAISARDLSKVRQLVEEQKCLVTGPGPWNQVPLNLAAKSGSLEIVQYLLNLQRGARPNEFTLEAAITSGSLHMLRFFRQACEWTVRDFEAAFNSPFAEIRRYAFEVASDEGWFEERYFMDEDGGTAYFAILSAARRSLLGLWDAQVFDDIIASLKENGEEHILYTVRGEESQLGWLHEFIRDRNTRGFAITWDTVHARLFRGERYADLDKYDAAKEVEDFFFAAIEHDCMKTFYLMLAYMLPNFPRCLEVARKCGKHGLLNYLSKCVTPASA